MDYSERKTEQARANAAVIGNLCNSTSAYPDETGKMIANVEHRYIQQEVWKMVEGMIAAHAQNYHDKRFDDRNAYTVKMAAKIYPLLDKFREEIAKGI